MMAMIKRLFGIPSEHEQHQCSKYDEHCASQNTEYQKRIEEDAAQLLARAEALQRQRRRRQHGDGSFGGPL